MPRARVLLRTIYKEAIDRAFQLHGDKVYPLLFVSRYGRELTYFGLRDTWRAAVKTAGIEDANIHDLRAKSLTDAKNRVLMQRHWQATPTPGRQNGTLETVNLRL